MNVRSDNASRSKATEKRRRGRPLVDDKRRIILDAALRVFADRGFHGTNVPEVAEQAGVGVGTLYRYFESKEALVNQVYRDAKQRLRSALVDGAVSVDLYQLDTARRWFLDVWRRLGGFAKTEPDAFRFLEMQDHMPYLDAESRQLELSVLAPLWMAGKKLRDRTAGAPVDVMIALLWGAFVGLIKAERLGYLKLDDKQLAIAGEQCWRMLAPDGPARADHAFADERSPTSRPARADHAFADERSPRSGPARADHAFADERSPRSGSARADHAFADERSPTSGPARAARSRRPRADNPPSRDARTTRGKRPPKG